MSALEGTGSILATCVTFMIQSVMVHFCCSERK